MRDLSKFLLPAKAGRLLGVTAVRVKQLEDAGRLRSLRVGPYRYYDPAEVATLAADRAAKRQAHKQRRP